MCAVNYKKRNLKISIYGVLHLKNEIFSKFARAYHQSSSATTLTRYNEPKKRLGTMQQQESAHKTQLRPQQVNFFSQNIKHVKQKHTHSHHGQIPSA